MRILFCVENFYPQIGGMAAVVRSIAERLVAKGDSVDVVTSYVRERNVDKLNGINIIQLSIHGNSVSGIEGDAVGYKNLLLQGMYDAVCICAAQTWCSDVFFEVASQVTCKKLFLPTGFSGLRNPLFKDYFLRMPQYLNCFDTVILHSRYYQDYEFCAAIMGDKRLSVIPNGADTKEFLASPRLRESKDKRKILHIGSITGEKGHLQALKILRNVKTPFEATFVGRVHNWKHFIKLQLFSVLWGLRGKVRFKKLDRKDTVELLYSADLFLFPSLVECSPLVLFESMAAGLPFVSTAVGNSFEIANLGSGFILPGVEKNGRPEIKFNEAANLIDNLLSTQDVLARMSERGRRAFLDYYNWDNISDLYFKLFHSLERENDRG